MGLLEQCETQAERKMVYSSIGSCPTEALKRQVLEWSVTSVKLQDFFYPLNRRDIEGRGCFCLCGVEHFTLGGRVSFFWFLYRDPTAIVRVVIEATGPSSSCRLLSSYSTCASLASEYAFPEDLCHG